jgi:hypothetical protein
MELAPDRVQWQNLVLAVLNLVLPPQSSSSQSVSNLVPMKFCYRTHARLCSLKDNFNYIFLSSTSPPSSHRPIPPYLYS